jgi:GT2 family glycosyltransferase
MLAEIQLDGRWFDSDYFLYYEDVDLGWRARLGGWQARFVADAVVRHVRNASTSRLDRAFLVKLTRTNRIRTLLKNGSWPLVLRSGPHSLWGILEVLWAAGPGGARHLVRAIRSSFRQRRQVEALRRLGRAELERRWLGS